MTGVGRRCFGAQAIGGLAALGLPLLHGATARAADPGPARAFDLQGHRGARGLAPENTLPAFARTLSIGVDTLELDIAITKDGVPVIAHDPTLNPDLTRDADGRFLEQRGPAIHTLTYAELQRYDVGRLKPGTRYASAHPDQQAVDGTRIPRLADLFALVERSGNTQVRYAIEIKTSPLAPELTLPPDSFAAVVVQAVREGGVMARSSVLSFDWRALYAVRKLAPEVPLVCLTIQRTMDNVLAGSREGSPWTAPLRYADHGSIPKLVRAAGGRVWSCYWADLDAAKVAEAHALGLVVLAWTVNDPGTIAAMLDLGVDGIVSDRPDRVREELLRRGRPVPKPTPVIA